MHGCRPGFSDVEKGRQGCLATSNFCLVEQRKGSRDGRDRIGWTGMVNAMPDQMVRVGPHITLVYAFLIV